MNDDRMPARKFYIRFREGRPDSELTAYALLGFQTLGIETACFSSFDDIQKIPDLGPEVGIAGYIGDVHEGLRCLRAPIPPNVDYPEVLTDFLGRRIWTGTLAEVRASLSPVFVKPRAHKAFTGFLWRGPADQTSRMRIVTHSDDVPVFMAEPVHFVAEYRSFIFHGDVIDCRRYRGDWSVAPNRDVVESAVQAMGEHSLDVFVSARRDAGSENAYSLDWGVTDDGRTLLVEMNDGYSLGHYGLPPVSYARMLAARWHQMTKVDPR